MKLILATKNPHKVREINAILKSHLGLEIFSQVEILSLLDFSDFPAIKEDGKTYAENALKKAREVFNRFRIPSFADDSGIEVDALDGEPGVFSAVYAGENASDAENNAKLLKKLENVPIEKRTARFRCIIAYVDDEGEKTFEGVTEGIVISQPRGENGFGYDPLFVPDGFNLTYAEMGDELKNSISHRAKAIKKFAEFLKTKIDER